MLNSTFPWIQKFFTPFMYGIVILFETFHDDTHGMKKKTNWNASKRISNPFDDHQFYMFKKATFCLLGNMRGAIKAGSPKMGPAINRHSNFSSFLRLRQGNHVLFAPLQGISDSLGGFFSMASYLDPTGYHFLRVLN